MNVLYLGPPSPLVDLLRRDVQVTRTTDPLDPATVEAASPDLVVSYGYRHVLRGPVLDALGGRAVNLHISLLPWNRGADPNLWSWVEETPKGVSLHLIDEGVDTGPLVVQREVSFEGDEWTLRQTYARLQREAMAMFEEAWPTLRAGRLDARPQPPGGSSHRLADRAGLDHLLAAQGWDTPVRHLVGAQPISPVPGSSPAGGLEP